MAAMVTEYVLCEVHAEADKTAQQWAYNTTEPNDSTVTDVINAWFILRTNNWLMGKVTEHMNTNFLYFLPVLKKSISH